MKNQDQLKIGIKKYLMIFIKKLLINYQIFGLKETIWRINLAQLVKVNYNCELIF